MYESPLSVWKARSLYASSLAFDDQLEEVVLQRAAEKRLATQSLSAAELEAVHRQALKEAVALVPPPTGKRPKVRPIAQRRPTGIWPRLKALWSGS
jgi:hypothetical protein